MYKGIRVYTDNLAYLTHGNGADIWIATISFLGALQKEKNKRKETVSKKKKHNQTRHMLFVYCNYNVNVK